MKTPTSAHPAAVLGMYETGLAVGRSLGRAGIRVLGLDPAKKVGFYSKHIDAALCPDPVEREMEFVSFLKRIAATEQDRPVLFLTADEFLLPVSRNRKDLEKHYLLNMPDPKIIECISDKYKQYRLAMDAGVPVPRTFRAENMEQLLRIKDQIPLPAFIKGAEVTLWRRQFGSGAKGFSVSTPQELVSTCQGIFGRRLTALIQEIIPGPETNHFKVSCYLSRNGEVLLAFCLQKIRQNPVGFGFGCLVQSVEYPELLDLGIRFFRKIGYRGTGSAEFKLDPRDGKLKLIELNPRYWQQNALADRCGMNFPLTDYQELTGANPQPVLKHRTGVKWINIYSDIESFREYRKRGQLSGKRWLQSLKGEKMFSDLEWDDLMPGLHEILVTNAFRRFSKYFARRF